MPDADAPDIMIQPVINPLTNLLDGSIDPLQQMNMVRRAFGPLTDRINARFDIGVTLREALEDRVDVLEQAPAAYDWTARVVALEQRPVVADLTPRVAALEAKPDLTSRVVALEQLPAVPDLTVRVVALEQRTTPPDLTNRVVALEQKVIPPDLTNRVVTLEAKPDLTPRVVALEQRVIPPDLTTRVVALEARAIVPDLTVRVVALEAGPNYTNATLSVAGVLKANVTQIARTTTPIAVSFGVISATGLSLLPPVSVNVPGVALGDAVQPTFAGTPPDGVVITGGNVTAVNTVLVSLQATKLLTALAVNTQQMHFYWTR